nr:NnrU family protein [Photobacterium sp. OFAV2-7]
MLWTLGNILINGDLASLLLFGSFLANAVFDLISVFARGVRLIKGTLLGGGH